MKKIVLITLLSVFCIHIFGQTTEINKLQKQRQALQQEIQNTNKLYLDVKKQTSTILQRIGLINKQIETRKKLIDVQQQEVKALEKQQVELENDIIVLNKEYEKKKVNYAKAISGMLNQKARQNQLFFVLSGKSFGESMRRLQYLKKYAQWRKSQAEELKKQAQLIRNKNMQLQNSKKNKLVTLSNLQNDKQKLEVEEKSKQSEVAVAKTKQKELQKTIESKKQQANKLNAQIENLIAQEIARQKRLAEERRKAELERIRKAKEEEARRKAEEQRLAAQNKAKPTSKKDKKTSTKTTAPLRTTKNVPLPPREETYVASAEEFNLSENFVNNRGRLPMPVSGAATIVSSFGVNRSNEWSNVSTNSNGIDIQGRAGAAVRSVYDGEVSRVFAAPGSNMGIIVRHGEYFSFYGNVVNLNVKAGDKVKAGQTLGRVFTDPDSGISTMHFQLWRGMSKLDPRPWLGR